MRLQRLVQQTGRTPSCRLVVPLLQQPLVVVLVIPLVVLVVVRTTSVVMAMALPGKVTVVVLVVVVTGHARVQRAVGAAAAAAALVQWVKMRITEATIAPVMVASGWRAHFSPQVLQQLWVLAR